MKDPAFSPKLGPSRLLNLVLQALCLLYFDSPQLRAVGHGVHTRPVKISHFHRQTSNQEWARTQTSQSVSWKSLIWFESDFLKMAFVSHLQDEDKGKMGEQKTLSFSILFESKLPAAGLLDFAPVSSEWQQHFFIPRRKPISFDENKISKQRRPSSIVNVYRAHNRSMNAPRISIRHLKT